MKLICRNYINFYTKKLVYLKGENIMVDKILSLKEDVKLEKNHGNLE